MAPVLVTVLVVQRIARAADIDLAGIAELAVLQHRRAVERQRAVVGDGAAVDRGRRQASASPAESTVIVAGIGDIDVQH